MPDWGSHRDDDLNKQDGYTSTEDSNAQKKEMVESSAVGNGRNIAQETVI